ncbi:MAG: 5'-deoxynucleotidase [Clostridiales bacterium]|jgi:5'-deoxynucleotidase|nr:5'-deoxynucleotidase [Clostridiales bacterium]
MKKHHFFAMISRMKYINRWALMRNAHNENLSEHSLEVSIIAHALVLIHNRRFGGRLNAERAALLAVFHDAPESLTGDMPTPVKYHNEQVRNAYKTVEKSACDALINMLPQDLKEDYRPFFFALEEDKPLWDFVKAADKISALIKCIEEEKAGNMDFKMAKQSIMNIIHQMNMPEADCFVEEFLPSFGLTLDDIKQN